MQTRSRSRRQRRLRASFCVTTACLFICALALAYYTQQSIRGIIAMFMTAAILEVILLNCKSPSSLSRLGGIPWFMWLFPIAMGNVGYHFIKGSALLQAEVALSIGVGIVSAVTIILVRWFHFHYHDVALYEVLSRRGLRRFGAQDEVNDHDA